MKGFVTTRDDMRKVQLIPYTQMNKRHNGRENHGVKGLVTLTIPSRSRGGNQGERSRDGYKTFVSLDQNGHYDFSMKEWTIYFSNEHQASVRPAYNISHLIIQVGEHFQINFNHHDEHNIHVRMYNIENSCEGEKNLSINIGNELMLLGSVTGCPEERDPNNDEDTVFEGDLFNWLRMVEREQLLDSSSKISFGCIIFKDCILRNPRHVDEEEKK